MLDPNSRSVEEDMKLAEADGYSLITDDSTMEGLIEEHNFMERWHTHKQKLKPYLVCKLKCAKDHNVNGNSKYPKFSLFINMSHIKMSDLNFVTDFNTTMSPIIPH